MKTWWLLGLLCLLAAPAPAQMNADSLWQVWRNKALPDSARLGAAHALSYHYLNFNPDSTLAITQLYLDFAREIKSDKWQARALNCMGLAHRLKSDYPRAVALYEQSLVLADRAGDRNYMSAVYGNLGDVYRLQSNFSKAVACIQKSLELAEATNDKRKVADVYVSIAAIFYDDPGNVEKTLEYLEKAQVVYEELNHPEGLALVYGNLTAVYLNLEQLDKALEYSAKSMEIQERLGDLRGVATSLHNRAIILTSQGKYAEAMQDFKREIAIFESLGDQQGLADAYSSLGDLWLRQKRYPDAIRMCGKALNLAHVIGSPNLVEVDACNCLFIAYREQGNHTKALDYLEQYVLAKDSLQQNETAQKLRQMEIQRQNALDSLGREKERYAMEIAHQQAIQQKDRTLGLLMAAGLGVLTVALALWVRLLYFRKRSQVLQLRSEELEKQQLLNEIALLRAQVNPHFLFNSLSILSSLVRVDPDLSEQFIDQLSRSYRYILEQREQTLVRLRTELEFIRAYVFLLKIRFENKFDVRIEAPEAALDAYQIAPLTLQLLVENAVKHNRMSAKEPLVVDIRLEADDALLVQNRLQPRAHAADSTGVGLQNIAHRYALLTERPVQFGVQGEFFIVKIPLLKVDTHTA